MWACRRRSANMKTEEFTIMRDSMTRVPWVLLLALGLAGGARAQNAGGGDPAVSAVQPSSGLPQGVAPSVPAAPPAQAFPLSAFSALGSSLAQTGHFAELGWSEVQFNAFMEGIRAGFQGKGYPMDDSAQRLAADVSRRIGEIAAHTRQAAWTPGQKGQLERYFKDMQKRLSLQVSGSGLGYNVQPGKNGIRPRPGDTIVLTVNATAADGTTRLPQLSAERIRVKMEGMMPGLMEGLQMMTVGSEAVFVIPPVLSFGDKPWPDGVERGSPLVYWVTLHDVTAAGEGR
jgi:FKBP-type peptidyl-prolyl cis-trans isomerase